MMKNKIRILHVAQAAGGVDRYIRMLLKYLDKEKFENILVCSQDFHEEDYRDLVDSFEQVEMTRAIGSSDLKAIKEVRALIKKYNPDIVYVAGVVDSEDYQLIREDYSRQYDGLRAALQEAENKKAEVERQIEEYLNMTSHLEEHLDDFEFDIQLVKSLVQKIEVSADKRIRIVFGFQDVFTELGKESAET